MSAKADKTPGLIAWMTRNSVAPNVLMVFLVGGGLMVFANMQREVFPPFTADIITISVPYPGASPEEVEQSVVLSIESSVRSLDGVMETRSTSREGAGTVTVEALPGTDLDELAQRLKSEVDRIRTIPLEAEEPEINVVSRRREVVELAIFGDVEETTLRSAAEMVRDALMQNPDITQIELNGEKPLEIAVEVSQENLRRYGLTLEQVAQRLRQASVELPAGGIKTEQGEVLVRMTERRDYGREFARTPIITTDDGSEVLLEDIATITDAFADVDIISRFNGKPSIGIDVYRVGDETPIQVSNAVQDSLVKIRADLPEAIDVKLIDDMATIYRGRMDLLISNGAIGAFLVVLLLGLFLEARLAFWVMLGIPISFLGGAIFLPLMGVSLNMVSMFAFILSLGILVDDAVVIGENIYSHHERGKPFLRAAIDGTRELAVPVTFAVLTNVAAFLPIIFVPGFIGKIFWMMPAVAITVFMISLVESLFILPAHLGHASDKPRRGIFKAIHNGQQVFSKGLVKGIHTFYRPFLQAAVGHRYVVMAIALSLLFVVLAWPISKRMGFSLFPSLESDTVRAMLVMPYGYPAEETEKIAKRINDTALKVAEDTGHPELVVGVSTRVGEGGSHSATVSVEMAPPEVRDKILPAREFVDQWRDEFGEVHGAESLLFSSERIGGRSSRNLTVELSHRDVPTLERACARLAEMLEAFPNVRDIDDGFAGGKTQLDFKLTPEGRNLGFTAQQVARQVRSSFYGAEVLRQQRGRNEIKVMVRLPDEQRYSEFNLDQLMLRTDSGGEVPLKSVVEVTRGRAFTEINRVDGRRIIEVAANVNPRSEVLRIVSAIQETELPTLLDEFPGLTYRFEGRQAEMQESMEVLRKGFALALCVIFALLAIALRSYTLPVVVMSSIPFGIIGAIVGHHIMGFDLSMISIFGIVALSGVVVNDSLVLVHSAERLREAGEDVNHAVVNASVQRFRPIILTTLTTFFGLTPIIFEESRQAQFLIPMALSLGYGIVFATLVTLVVVPSLYLILDDMKKALSLVWRFMTGDFTVPDEKEEQKKAA